MAAISICCQSRPAAMYGECAEARQHRPAPDRKFCKGSERQTSPAPRDCQCDIHCAVDLRAARRLRGCSLQHSAPRQESALSNILEFVPGPKTPRGCIEPSWSVAFISFCHQLVGHELSAIRLGQTLGHRSSFIIRHRVETSAPRFDLTGILRKLVLILPGPGRGMFHDIFERVHTGTIPQRRFSDTGSLLCSIMFRLSKE
jgi:hypothetical protein